MAHSHDASNSVVQGNHEYKNGSYVPVKAEDLPKYPKYLHKVGESLLVNSPEEEQAAGDGWFSSPARAARAAAKAGNGKGNDGK
jgi:hypothetical protein